MAVDSQGTVFFGAGSRVYKVSSSGNLTPVAGTGSSNSATDGAPALNSALGPYIRGLTVDPQGDLFLVTDFNGVIEVTPDGILHVISSTSTGFAGDGGPVKQAKFTNPLGIASDSAGNVYIGDSGNNRLRRIGTDGTVTTIAGTGSTGFGAGSFYGDGDLAVNALLNEPWGVAADSAGNVFFVDTLNHRVREILAR